MRIWWSASVDRQGSCGRKAHYFSNPPTPTTESAQLTAWDGQLYLVLGDELEDGRWQLRALVEAFRDADLGRRRGLIALGGVARAGRAAWPRLD